MFDFLKTLPKAAAVLQRALVQFAAADLDFMALTGEGVKPEALAELIAQRSASAVETATAGMQSKLDLMEAERDAARESQGEAVAALDAVQGALVAAGFERLDAGAESLAADFTAAVEARIGAAAVERLAESGVPAAELPPVTAEAKPDARELRKQFEAMSDAAERARFYAAHREVLLT